MIETLLKLSKYLLLSFILLLCWMVYKVIIVPIMFRRKYRKYKNVYVSDKFTPILGDLSQSLEDVKNGKVYYNHITKKVKELKDIDIKVNVEGIVPKIKLVSAQAAREFFDLMQQLKVDRNKRDGLLGYVIPNSLNQCPTNAAYIKQKKFIISLAQQNNVHKYTPGLIKSLNKVTKRWDTFGESYINLGDETELIGFDSIFRMMFGEECSNMVDEEHVLMDYINHHNQVEKIPLRKFVKN